MQQPPFQDPNNLPGQPSFYLQSEQPSTPQPPLSPEYNVTGSDGPFRYPGEDLYASQPFSQEGPITHYRSGSQAKLFEPAKPRNPWKALSLVLGIVTIVLATTVTALLLIRPNVTILGANGPAVGVTQVVPQPTSPSTSGITVPATSTPASTNATPVNTTPTVPVDTSNNYSATQPGPGCDTNGGKWTPQGISNITCGTRVTPNTASGYTYLYFQLPENRPFAADNRLGVIGTLDNSQCIGLAEQDADIGYLVGYCNDGSWFIDQISNDGVIVQTLDKNLTSTRRAVNLSFILTGTTLAVSVDQEVHQVKDIKLTQPTRVAIAFYCYYVGNSITVTNFSYITPPN